MIYFAQTGDNRYIKIGYASQVDKRIEGLRTASPLPIKLLASLPGDVPIERQIHARFEGLRANREWFHAHRDIVAFAVSASRLAGVASDQDKVLPYLVHEPRLIDLLIEAACTVDDPNEERFCANDVFFGYYNPRNSIKRRLTNLVGWYAKDARPALRTEQAYDAVYERIYDALPDCRNCGCFGGGR